MYSLYLLPLQVDTLPLLSFAGECVLYTRGILQMSVVCVCVLEEVCVYI